MTEYKNNQYIRFEKSGKEIFNDLCFDLEDNKIKIWL